MIFRRELKENEAYLPVTFQQFEDLTNEMLKYVNEVTAPQALDGNFMANVIMGVIHGLDRKTVIINKQELFDRAINLISNQVTHQAVEAIMTRLKTQLGESQLQAVPDDPNVQ